MAGFHPVRQLAPAALNAGLRADSCRSSLRNQAAEVDPKAGMFAASTEANLIGYNTAVDRGA